VGVGRRAVHLLDVEGAPLSGTFVERSLDGVGLGVAGAARRRPAAHARRAADRPVPLRPVQRRAFRFRARRRELRLRPEAPLSPAATPAAAAPAVDAAGPIRFALAGCGAIAQLAHLPALARTRGVRVTALCDLESARARALAERFGVPDTFTDVEELLDAACATP
jgi:hypothetical protein